MLGRAAGGDVSVAVDKKIDAIRTEVTRGRTRFDKDKVSHEFS